MKKIILIFITAITLAGLFQACKKDKEILQTKLTAEQFEWVGIEHNEELEKVYAFIKENHISMRTERDKVKDHLIESARSNTDYDTTGIEVTVSYIEEIFSSTSSNYQANAKSISNNSDYKYSQEHNLYIEELFHLFDDTLETSHATLFQSIVLLEKEIEQNERLTEQELISLFSATQVAQHSYTYWSYHFEDWLILGDITKKHGGGRGNRKPNRSSTMGHRALNIAKGDVGGALAGAAGAWAVNIVPGMGQVAYGGAILGASVAGSTGAAFMEITNYFGW